MNVRDYMHQITEQNANTLASEEGQGEGKRKMTKEEALQEQQSKNKVRFCHWFLSCYLCKVNMWFDDTQTAHIIRCLASIHVCVLSQRSTPEGSITSGQRLCKPGSFYANRTLGSNNQV